MSNKKLKYDELYNIQYDLEDMSLDLVIDFIKRKQSELLKLYKNRYLRFEFKSIPDYYSHSDKEYLNIVGVREETDAEYEQRLKEEQSYELQRKELELKQLEFLKNKYGDR